MAGDEEGKYDDASEFLLRKHMARVSAVIILGGNRGNGFSVSCTQPQYASLLPEMLRAMAAEIEAQNANNPRRPA